MPSINPDGIRNLITQVQAVIRVNLSPMTQPPVLKLCEVTESLLREWERSTMREEPNPLHYPDNTEAGVQADVAPPGDTPDLGRYIAPDPSITVALINSAVAVLGLRYNLSVLEGHPIIKLAEAATAYLMAGYMPPTTAPLGQDVEIDKDALRQAFERYMGKYT